MIRKLAIIAVMCVSLCCGVYASEPMEKSTPELDTPLKFKGQDVSAFSKWLSNRVYSGLAEQGVSGDLLAEFIIEKDGSVRDIQIIESPHPKYSKNIIKLIEKTSGKWTPGYKDGQAVRVRYAVPLCYSIDY